MGNCVALNFSCDDTVKGIIKCLGGKDYIRNLKKNLRALSIEMEDLKAIQNQVQNKVAREEEAGDQQTFETVQVWLTRVESIDTRVNALLSASPIQLQFLCFFGKCSKNGCSSYKYGKKVSLLLEQVKKLKSEGNFEEVAGAAPRSVVEEMPTKPTIGHETMLETSWNRLMEDEVGIMGLHGMGGVGKTTLLTKINNKFAEIAGRFDIVISVVVSQGAEISKLQDDIAKRLKKFNERWTNKNESEKAAKIYKDLKNKRFVLLLDDIWEKVDLEAIGIPFPNRENGCKVAFTTRSREVCGRMGDHEPLEVKCLEKNESLELFQEKVGKNTLRRGPDIVELSRKMAEKCRGLPLALSVIGETMASKTKVQEWEHALDVLTKSAAKFSDMENKILPILKYSYENLVDEDTKSCFLYCALFPEDYKIDKERLIEYWIGEGFLGEYQTLKRVKNKGYEVLGSLIRTNLIIEVNKNVVVMHDVVREMALWIASDFGNQKETFCVQASEVQIIKDWGAVRRMSLMCNSIEEITCGSKVCELTTLFLQKNKLKSLSGDFIQSMQKLVVLDLSGNTYFNELPEHISELASLQFLDLSYTRIEQLPVDFQELKKLTQLNLTHTKRLHSIERISKLSSLRILKLIFSKAHGDVCLVKKLQLLEQLQFLTITISTELGLQNISGDQRLANCIESLNICKFEQTPLDISLLMSMENLRELCVDSCHVWKNNTYMKCRESKTGSSCLHKSTIPCFTNLSHVIIVDCNIKDLTWLLFVPNLVSLNVNGAEEVEEIINKEKATNFMGISPFQKLESMLLRNVPKLKSIHWNLLPLPSLKSMISDCPDHRSFHTTAKGVLRIHGGTSSYDPRTDFKRKDKEIRLSG